MLMTQHFQIVPWVIGSALFVGCATQHEVKTESEIKPVYIKTEHEIKPIHITIDVNLKIDRELDDFFGDLDEQSPLLIDMEPTTAEPSAQ